MKLKPTQKAFADYYVISMNATEAYQRAYPRASAETARRNGHRLLTKADIHAYITDIMSKKDNERIMSQNEVLEFLSDVAKGKITEQTPLVLGREFQVIDKEPSIKDRIRAAELLGKRYALFTERIESSSTNEIIVTWGDEDGSED